MAKRTKGTVPWKVWVPAMLALRIEMRYIDPATGKPQYAARSHMITALLFEFDRVASELEQTKPELVREVINRMIAEAEAKAQNEEVFP